MSSEESNKMSPKKPLKDSHSEPKIKLTFEKCYNYNQLKKEGLVDYENPRPEEDIAEMMRVIVDAEDINFEDMAGG